MVENLAVGLAFGLIGIGLVAILISGIRNVINGKSEIRRVAALGVPVAVFAISYASFGTFNQAGIATMMFMMGAMVLGILVTGTRGTFKF
jgi:hypothetical protein